MIERPLMTPDELKSMPKGQFVVSPPIPKEPVKPFELPPRNGNMRRVFAYLINRRGIDREAKIFSKLLTFRCFSAILFMKNASCCKNLFLGGVHTWKFNATTI